MFYSIRSFIAIVCLLLGNNVRGIDITLYIEAGEMTTSNEVVLPALSFSISETFSQKPALIQAQINEEINLELINNDDVAHGFVVENVLTDTLLIPAGQSGSITLNFDEMGCYSFYDPLDFPKYRYLGLAGTIAILPEPDATAFFWDLREHQSEWNTMLDEGSIVDWETYYPIYFTVNGFSSPDIDNDTDARVTGAVNDELLIYISNNGWAAHSLHFHGYHCEILFSSQNGSWIGREKDTFPILRGEQLILKLVPHQPGVFPVHDHNLVAVTGAGMYLNGMFTTLMIEP